MAFYFATPTRDEILGVECPKCGAVFGELCRRPDGKMHAPRIAKARSVVSQQRRALLDAKRNTKAKRVARDWLKP